MTYGKNLNLFMVKVPTIEKVSSEQKPTFRFEGWLDRGCMMALESLVLILGSSFLPLFFILILAQILSIDVFKLNQFRILSLATQKF